jgi:eukaryotic-like serine/threonine-protein kinase
MLEAQVTGQLTHPHIVPVYQLGENSQTGAPYYAMRLIQGETLRKAIAKARKSPGGMSIVEYRRLLAAFVSVCNALAYAHTRGVVHRDLKPENVVLGEFGEVLVIDWGLAKVAGHEDEPVPPVEVSTTVSSSETLQGTIMGTPVYMAPEQAAGDINHIDSRTDVLD